MNKFNKEFLCFPGGGLGNRLGEIISAFHFSFKTKSKLHIIWEDENPSCQISYEKIFENSELINFYNKKNKFEIFKKEELLKETSGRFWNTKIDNCLYMVHDLSFYADKDNAICHRNLSHEEILYRMTTTNNKYIRYADNGISRHVNAFTIDNFFQHFKIKKEILEKAKNLCEEIGINKDTLGFHLRMTDQSSAHQHHPQRIEEIINSRINQKIEENYFVASDEEKYEISLEQKFGNEKIKRNKKRSYTNKYSEEDEWIDRCYDKFPSGFNVLRGEESVIEALTDCLLLSKTNLNFSPHTGSFLKLAKLFSMNPTLFN